MSSKIKSLEEALKAKKAAKEEEQEAAQQQFAVQGEAPERVPHVGQTVEFTWADPTMIGSPKMDLALFVSKVAADSEDGRLNGWVLMDPSMQMADRSGRPVQVPPLIPVGNVPYSRDRKPMTWRFHGDFAE